MALHQAKVENGILEGIPGGNPSITVFKGVPYAAPPIGDNRWRPPQPLEDWEGIYKADHFAGICPQNLVEESEIFRIDNPLPYQELTEDCLYLNIWTPAVSREERLPVLFWIHGGANVTGYGHQMCFDGETFAKRGVILVTFNWRVNIFGWLVHRELSEESPQGVSGNYGILDQIAALKWVKNNIASFGGNPDNITIGGESAGASSVFSLCMTPLARGMFQRAIMQSGGGFDIFASPTFLSLKQMEADMNLEKLLGVHSIQEARSLDALEVERRIQRPEAAFAYLPMQAIDGYVFPKDLKEMALNNEYPNIPYIIGYTKDESFMYVYPEDRQAFIQGQRDEYGDYAEHYLKLCDFLQDEEAFRAHLFSRNAELLKTAAINWAEIVESHGNQPVYMYCFDRVLPDGYGAYHSAELWYLFGTLFRNKRKFTGADYELSEKMTDYWANFARSGDPNGQGLAVWTPYTKASPLTMRLGLETEMGDLGMNERILFRKNYLMGRLPGQAQNNREVGRDD